MTRRLFLWDWETGHTKLSFRSGHLNDVLQAKFMPYTDDRSLVICAADGEIDLRTATATKLFICCPIDDSRVYTRIINLNAIMIDPRNPNLFALGGSDEYTRLYDLRKYKSDGSTDFGLPFDRFCPRLLIGEYQVGITGLAFSDQSELLVHLSLYARYRIGAKSSPIIIMVCM
ncbi:hypothetical protein Gorai_017516 [Gossypium raimondii]|uniref:Uncharacterized protein n=1 Tax=Gossypium raimondii TaxID=29730 RepID=A0A7J8PBZ5_GOSRA|nr:hypothetical protein [Gossypium raimondii]